MANTTSGPLVWMDMEMSGLDPDRDVILEVATVITDAHLKIIAQGPSLVIQRPASLFDTMDDWNKTHHTQSGLWQSVIDSKVTDEQAMQATLEFIKSHCPAQASPLCGNSIWQDRRFLAKYWQPIDRYLHYRIIDVSTIKELTARWRPGLEPNVPKKNSHRAMDDICESIEELRFYKEQLYPHI